MPAHLPCKRNTIFFLLVLQRNREIPRLQRHIQELLDFPAPEKDSKIINAFKVPVAFQQGILTFLLDVDVGGGLLGMRGT